MNREQVWRASAPSNIALIKYMGKVSHQSNRPSNSSLSLSLEYLRTGVEIVSHQLAEDVWEPLENPEFPVKPQLSEKGRARFLAHFAFLKSHWGIKGHYLIRSANNFPSDCGLASSASSFAALTLAAADLARTVSSVGAEALSLEKLSALSRQGSGSSCRSLFSPWSLWRDEGAERVEMENFEVWHQVLIVDSSIKAVSSSEAHRRVSTSPHFLGRVERAEQRLLDLLQAMRSQDWAAGFRLCWDEFQDMHRLFETAVPPFQYRTPQSFAALDWLKVYWETTGDGPWVTMDAGANIHLLYRPDQKRVATEVAKGLAEFGRMLSHG